MFDLRWRELYSVSFAMRSKPVDHRSAGITQTQKFRHFVEGLARGIIPSVADVLVGPRSAFLRREIEMRVASGNHESQHRKLQFAVAFLALFQQHRVDVSLKVVDRNQWFVEGKR